MFSYLRLFVYTHNYTLHIIYKYIQASGNSLRRVVELRLFLGVRVWGLGELKV